MRYKWLGAGITLGLAAISAMVLRLSAVTAEPDPSSVWRVVGQIGGPTQAVAVQGDYAYVGVGLRLVVLDISDPANLTEVGSTTPFPYFVEDVVVSGTLAYVAAGGAGLRVVDIAASTNPTEVGAWDSPGYAEGVAVSGTAAYLADGPYGLRVVDVSDPDHPMPLGAAYDMNYAFDVAASGNYAYVAAAGAGLLVADLSDPARLVEAGGSDTLGYAYGVAVCGAVAYVADGWEGLQVISVSNPLSPALRGRLDTPGWAMAVSVAGTTAFLADGENGLRVVDVSDLDRPQETGACEAGGMARDVAVSGKAVLVADQRGGLRLIDATDASRPAQMGLYSPLTDARRVTVSGTVAYVAAGHSGLRLVDVSSPHHPVEVGAYDTQGSYASSVAISGTHAYLATYVYGPQGLHVLDVSNPAHPIRVGALILDTDGGYRDIVLQGHTVYVANEWGLRLIDVSQPHAPALLGLIPLAHQTATTGVAVSGTFAYVGNCADGLEIVDVSNPLDLVRVSALDTPGSAGEVAVAGARVFIGDAGSGLRIVDVSNPQSPVELGFYDTPGSAQSPAISGTTVFVSDNGGGVQVLDVSTPSSPTPVQAIDTPGFAWDTALAGGYAYVADGYGGLLILECTTQGIAVDNGDSSVLDSSSDSSGGTFAAAAGLSGPRVAVAAQHVAGNTHDHPSSAVQHTAIFTVASSLDSGPSTLRQALLDARPGDTITFDPSVFPPTSPVTVALSSPLPPITQGHITIDGSNAGVILDGSALSKPPGVPGPEPDGLSIRSDGNTVRGLQILHFRIGVYIYGGQNNIIGGDRMQGSGPTGQGNVISENGVGIQIQEVVGSIVLGNLIGTDAGGTAARGNGTGIVVYGATQTRIGGASAGTRNTISGNTWAGVYLNGERTVANTVAGNYIGTDISGTKPLGNGDGGVAIGQGASGNVVGGTTPQEQNVISGQIGGAGNGGVVIIDPGTTHNAVTGNFIGTDASGTVALRNDNGVRIWMADHNRIGGTADGERNVISGNGSGITIMGAGRSDNVILGNYIGIDVTGAYTLPNYVGVNLQGSARRTMVGGMTATECNVISGNGFGIWMIEAGTEYNFVMGNLVGLGAQGAALGNTLDGILLRDGVLQTTIQGNTVAHGGGNGIRISRSDHNTVRRNAVYSNAGHGIGLTDGGNGLLAAPVVTMISPPHILGTACPRCTVEVFSDDEDEGRIYEGTTVADAEGRFSFGKPGGLTGPHITATATDSEGNTSQFSSPAAVMGRIYLPVVSRGCSGRSE